MTEPNSTPSFICLALQTRNALQSTTGPVLPGSIDKGVAATVMNANRWIVGGALMQSASPEGWRGMVDARNFVQANKDELASCAEAAAKTKKDQRCTVTASAPAK